MSESHAGELSYLRRAIRASKKEGLFEEFSAWYRMGREDGHGIIEAASDALYEWDILDDIVVNDDGSVSLGLKMDK
jgi:hypothetical protein